MIKGRHLFLFFLLMTVLMSGCGREAGDQNGLEQTEEAINQNGLENSEETGNQNGPEESEIAGDQDEPEQSRGPIQIYWSLQVQGCEVSLRDGAEEGTLELWLKQNDEEKLFQTYRRDYADYQTPEDISGDTFQDIMGHDGFHIYRRHPLGGSYYYFETDCYAVGEDPLHLAYYWGDQDKDVYQVDVDGDGIGELICNVQWMADGALDVYIYHFDGEKVVRGYGSDLLQEEFINNFGVGSMGAEYKPELNKVNIWYWVDAKEGFEERDYEIEFDKIEMWEFE